MGQGTSWLHPRSQTEDSTAPLWFTTGFRFERKEYPQQVPSARIDIPVFTDVRNISQEAFAKGLQVYLQTKGKINFEERKVTRCGYLRNTSDDFPGTRVDLWGFWQLTTSFPGIRSRLPRSVRKGFSPRFLGKGRLSAKGLFEYFAKNFQ